MIYFSLPPHFVKLNFMVLFMLKSKKRFKSHHWFCDVFKLNSIQKKKTTGEIYGPSDYMRVK